MPEPERRFPRALYGSGTEPDPRFSLANERTFLAWIRTSLALLASGVALEILGRSIHPGFRLAGAIVLIAAGIAAPVQAWVGWLRTERAMRLGTTLPSPCFSAPLAIAVVAAGVLVVLGTVIRP